MRNKRAMRNTNKKFSDHVLFGARAANINTNNKYEKNMISATLPYRHVKTCEIRR